MSIVPGKKPDYTGAFDSPETPPGGGLAAFDAAVPAADFAPIPAGIYAARVVRGEYCTTKAGADAYRMKFEVSDGDHAGKTVVRTWTFTPKALSYTKLALAAFGLTTMQQLLTPFPDIGRVYHVRLVVTLQDGGDGIYRNDIKRIEVVRVDDSPAAAFRLTGGAGDGGRA